MLKIFIIILSSAFLFFGALKTIQACSFFEESDNKDFSVFAPEIIHQPDKTPFFLSYHIYYGHEAYAMPETIPTMTERNSTEWVEFFNHRIKKDDLEWLIYGSTVHQLELTRKNFAGEKVDIDTLNKAFLSQARAEKDILEILDYIILAKRSEPYFNPDYSSWEPISYDSVFIEQLIPVFKEKFLQAKNVFLKNRYGFQLTRALCLRGKYTECIDLFDKVFKPGKEAGSMYYRSMGYKARALYKMGNYSRANYLYSYLYEHDPCGRYPAFQSFHPQEEADWNATLELAGSTREKEMLWHLLGIYTDPLRGMKEIYSLNPKSDLLPLLLVRAVNLAEEYSLANPIRGYFYDDDYSSLHGREMMYGGYGFTSDPEKIDSSSNKSLVDFISQVTRENKAQAPVVWQLSSAYLFLLNGALSASDKILSGLRIDPKDSLMLGQAEILKGLLAVQKTSVINSNQEKLLYGHIQNILSSGGKELRKENAVRYMLSQLSLRYAKKNDSLKKELCYPQGEKFYRSSNSVQQMISFMNRKDLNGMEKFLVSQYPLHLSDLYNAKAVTLMYEYRFKEAVKEFESAEGSGRRELYGNPFTIHITDCHDCDHRASQKTKYTTYSFAKKMIELKAKGDTSSNMEDRAQNYFLYANGLYNMTWYGNGRFIHETSISFDDYDALFDDEKGDELRKSSYFDCHEAMNWYQKAFSLSKNKEFRAKCTWMSAKCEHNTWLEEGDFETDKKEFAAGKYFTRMKNEFGDTKYYQEAIKECGYFCTFITHSDKCKRNPDL